MKSLKITLLLLAICMSNLAFSHALWIETNPIGVLQQKHQVKIFFGEYAQQESDPIKKWYSDLSDIKIYLLSPDNKKTELNKKANEGFYETEFTPTLEGNYHVYIEHPTKAPYETTAFEFSSIAQVVVGNAKTNQIPTQFGISYEQKKYAIGQKIDAKLWYRQAAHPDAEITIISPSGWTKTTRTNQQGNFSIMPLEKGMYLIEGSTEEMTERDWFGKSINKIWKGTTTTLFVD